MANDFVLMLVKPLACDYCIERFYTVPERVAHTRREHPGSAMAQWATEDHTHHVFEFVGIKPVSDLEIHRCCCGAELTLAAQKTSQKAIERADVDPETLLREWTAHIQTRPNDIAEGGVIGSLVRFILQRQKEP